MRAAFFLRCVNEFISEYCMDKLRCHFRVRSKSGRPVSVHNCSQILHLNGTDRAGAQNEINVGCSICLMVFMVSDGGIGWRRLARGLWRGTSLWKASVLVFCTEFFWNKFQHILCLELWVYLCVCSGWLCLVFKCSHFVKCCPVVCII